MQTKPCPCCAHTANPGYYVGFDFVREKCRTCKGATTVPAVGARITSIKIDGVEFAGNPTDLEISEALERGVDMAKRERDDARSFVERNRAATMAQELAHAVRLGLITQREAQRMIEDAADTPTLAQHNEALIHAELEAMRLPESLMRPAGPGRGVRPWDMPSRFDVALTPHNPYALEVVNRSNGERIEVKVDWWANPDEYGPWEVRRHYPEQGSEGETWVKLKRCDWPLDAVQAAVAFYTEYRVRQAFG